MKIYTSLFLTIVIFFSVATPVATSSTQVTPSKKQQIDYLRSDNLVLLRLINFKAKYGSYEEYYKQTDSSISEQ